ncbi:MAG: serine hydrolase domain-containing protein [Pseudobdellovibrionaceae bacterium]
MRFLFALFLFSISAQAAKLEGLEPKIDKYIKENQEVDNVGIAVGIVHKGELVFFKGYGYRDRANKLPVTPNTLFRIASNTKSFMATSLAMAEEKGKVNLEVPVRDVLPDFKLENEDISNQATLVDLLSHRVGLPRHDAFWYFTPFTRAELFSKLQYLEMNKNAGAGFREMWQYNNLMYMTLGIVGEKISGLSWDNLIKTEILSPLNMTNTMFTIAEMQNSSDYAFPYAKKELLALKPYEAMTAAGAMVSNTNDLVKWVRLFLSNGKTTDGTQIISLATIEKMFQVESISTGELPVKYCRGWFINEIAGHKLLWHGGNIDGYSSIASFMPDADLGVIVLVNQTAGIQFQLPFPLMEDGKIRKFLPLIIYEHLLDQQEAALQAFKVSSLNDVLMIDTKKSLLKQNSVKKFSVLNTGAKTMLGTFTHPAYGDLELYNDLTGNLRMNYYGNDWKLIPTSTIDVYHAEDLGIKVTVQRTGKQISTVLVPFEPSVSDIRFR